ncbi:MAG TPA: hypothetical protein VGV59_02025 [Pyrinomonadaceae bacterium]|nr:hypothetical protein [Pyrinomonadaceae bacterium]
MLYDFELAGRRVRLWQRTGETYNHVLMKALGFAMFVEEFPQLSIERGVGMRYKPDLVAESEHESGYRFAFWGECGLVSMRKVAWLVKHGQVARLALFKIDCGVAPLINELRAAVEPRYRLGGRIELINFAANIAELAASRRVERVPREWYTRTSV